MLDTGMATRLQRTRGRAAVRLKAAARGAALVNLAQAGSAKAMIPNAYGAEMEVVLLNTAGGLTGGDHLNYEIVLEPGARATATTQTAERAYASSTGAARLDVTLAVGPGGRLDWIPQETILFDTAKLHRRTDMALGGDAACLICETVVLGRAAMGETLAAVSLSDRRRVTRDGRVIYLDPFTLDDTVLDRRNDPALLQGQRALSTVVFLAQGAEDALASVRAVLDTFDMPAAASAWDGRLVVRLAAADGWPLRRALAAVLTQLRGGPLPRVWQI